MKMNVIDLYELVKVEELEEKSAPAVVGSPVVGTDTIVWDT